MRKLSIVAAFCILIANVNLNAFGANEIQGTICKSVGAKKSVSNISYLCVKSGKKLIWKISITQKIPPQTNSTTPLTNGSGRLEILDNGLQLLRNQIKSNYDDAPINVTIEPGIEGLLWVKDSVKSIKSAKQLLSAFDASPVKPVNAYVVWNINFMKPILNQGCFSWAPNSGGGACGPETMWANLQWFGNNIQVDKPSKMTGYSSEHQKQWILANFQHELAHVGQQTLASSVGTQNTNTPAWLREGEAEVFKVMSYANQFNLTYSKSREIYFSESNFRCSTISLKDLSEPKSYESACEYDNGLLATEYLIQRVGDIQALFWWDSRGVGTNVREQFKSAFNLDYDQFIVDADKYIKSQK